MAVPSAPVSDRIKQLIGESEGLSRTDLASSSALAPSTVSQLVRQLIEQGEVEETEGESTGGRRPRLLRLRRRPGTLGVAEIGSQHVRLGVSDGQGRLLGSTELPITIANGPTQVFDTLAEGWSVLRNELDTDEPLRGIGLALPGPVNVQRTAVSGAARMPGWTEVDLPALLTERFGVPAVIENDARAGAIGEFSQRPDLGDFLYVKAGSGIGGAWMSEGRPYRGALGFGGDLTHTRVPDAGQLVCSCGNTGCLETVGSGAGIKRLLAAEGIDADSLDELLTMSRNGNAQVTTRLRTAGGQLGQVLSAIVNFLNPHTIVVGGSLSSVGAYVAGMRAVIYADSLPICTTDLTITESRSGADAALLGMTAMIRQTTLTS
ncbi:putative NBD/HSP70 family sugar kinase [Propionibacteriaceae bacterium ES.041]|nr:ROK family transcriptional regulator [Enemella evansiae]PFG65725.1 putative NBD/HSP70 family sugar kinase [Propionibacteriaceae bacterium ES.041]